MAEISGSDVAEAAAPEAHRLSILGATGSVGESTLSLIEHAPAGTFDVVALTAHSNVQRLAEAAVGHRAEIAVIGDEQYYPELKSLLAGTGIEAAGGETALIEAADRETLTA